MRDHPVVRNVSRVGFQSSCSISPPMVPLGGIDLTVRTDTECALVTLTGLRDPSGRIRTASGYPCERTERPVFLVAKRYGKGRVIAVGSWKIFLDDFSDDPGLDNLTLFRNAVGWLAGRRP